jgi:branched-chain amino acid transport system substrate-binding protein
MLISNPDVMGVVGHLNSGCSIPAASVYARKNVVMINPASTNPKLTLLGLKNVFRVCATDAVQGPFIADFLYGKRGLKSVAVIHDKTPYGQGLAERFAEQFKKDGGEVTDMQGIALGDRDFGAVLVKMKLKSPQAIFYGGVYSEAGLISRQSKEMGMNVPLIAGDGTFSPEFINIGGQATEGDIVTMFGPPIEKTESARKFVEEYRKRFPGVKLQPYDAYTYDATKIIIEAVVNAGKARPNIIDFVRGIKFKGVTGDTSFDANGDTLNKVLTPYVVKNGKFEPVE